MVTNLMSDAEPLKWKLREKSLTLVLDFTASFGFLRQNWAGDLSDKFADAEFIISRVDEILSLLEIALGGGSVSSMNFSILKQEYNSLRSILLENFSAKNFSAYLLAGAEGNFSRIGLAPVLIDANRVNNQTLSKDPEAINQKSTYLTEITTDNKSIPVWGGAKPQPNTNRVNSTKNHSSENIQKGGRRNLITGYLKGRTWTSIKDIARAVPGCSVKTIQRELVDLVSDNVLEKTGERRWSRYQLR